MLSWLGKKHRPMINRRPEMPEDWEKRQTMAGNARQIRCMHRPMRSLQSEIAVTAIEKAANQIRMVSGPSVWAWLEVAPWGRGHGWATFGVPVPIHGTDVVHLPVALVQGHHSPCRGSVQGQRQVGMRKGAGR